MDVMLGITRPSPWQIARVGFPHPGTWDGVPTVKIPVRNTWPRPWQVYSARTSAILPPCHCKSGTARPIELNVQLFAEAARERLETRHSAGHISCTRERHGGGSKQRPRRGRRTSRRYPRRQTPISGSLRASMP